MITKVLSVLLIFTAVLYSTFDILKYDDVWILRWAGEAFYIHHWNVITLRSLGLNAKALQWLQRTPLDDLPLEEVKVHGAHYVVALSNLLVTIQNDVNTFEAEGWQGVVELQTNVSTLLAKLNACESIRVVCFYQRDVFYGSPEAPGKPVWSEAYGACGKNVYLHVHPSFQKLSTMIFEDLWLQAEQIVRTCT